MALNILLAAAEAAPFAKVGGMADVLGSLPQALRQQGADARVIMPLYGNIAVQKWGITHLFSFPFHRRTGTTQVSVFTTVHDGVPFYFVKAWPYFGEEQQVYSQWDWDSPRFIFFNQVLMGVIWQLHQRLGWSPDAVQVNDWHTGLLPFLLYVNRFDPFWGRIGTLLSIHNLAYQGDNVGGWLWEQGIPTRDQPDLVYQDLTNNLMAIAVAYSDIVTTVSPRYAIEIQYPSITIPNGLDGLIRTRVEDVYGVLNGLDMQAWNPATDQHLVSQFDAENFRTQRPANKAHLQRLAGLEVHPAIPVIGVVSRLVWQKGFDLALPALRRLLVHTNVQFVLLGSGEDELEHAFWRLGEDFNWRARVWLGYNAAQAQQIYAGSDMFLMPSHYEPCGIGQMIAMRYGSLPVVRETGGLADTVENYDNGNAERGTGFVFGFAQHDAVLNTLRWAVETYQQRRVAWERMQERALRLDLSWDKSAQEYIRLYEKAIQKRSI